MIVVVVMVVVVVVVVVAAAVVVVAVVVAVVVVVVVVVLSAMTLSHLCSFACIDGCIVDGRRSIWCTFYVASVQRCGKDGDL